MILEKVRQAIKKYNLVERDDRILIGSSGGPDSTALLYLLNNLSKELKITLYVAHLDHLLRKDSARDKIFVEKLAQKLKLPLISSSVNVQKLAKAGGSLEEIARNVRLNFLFKTAQKIKADKIALGHHLDDQAETVLMRILRGTGLFGLAGILAKRKICGFTIIRPLIEIRRQEIDGFLEKIKIKPCIDTSNLKDIYLRNKIRNKLLPLLEREYNQNIREILSNLAESASLDYDYLMQQARKITRGMGRKVNLNKYLKLHPAIQRLVLRMKIARLKGDLRRITFVHIREIEDLIFSRPINSIVDLPGKVSVVKKKNSLIFKRDNS